MDGVDDGEQVLLNDAVGGYDAVALSEILFAGIVGHDAACLLHNECASHVVPLTNVLFGVTVETSCCHIT